MHVCIDYRCHNEIILFNAYLMPQVDTLLDKMGGQVLSALDLTKAYGQIPLAKADRQKTAFTTPLGL